MREATKEVALVDGEIKGSSILVYLVCMNGKKEARHVIG